ncbi:rho GTPase-activating protein 45 isoform X2 [Dunckerocampus dactyliophorus]|uniref:rho GTPase-activating protein 45 isoform X2 n=1 Tax=Dunckerocampus dactyliophorus TaxID=161453 RepID=UPI002406A87C|nr:rho GTPase-activating protein 45 isoform X2 [Dunckerocampus dactyliophorus]
MSDNRRRTERHAPWIRIRPDDTDSPLSSTTGGTTPKWRVGGWVGGLYVRLKEVGMEGRGTLKMFTRKKRELIKTPSISKKSRTGSPGPPNTLSILQEQPRKDGSDLAFSSPTSSSSSSSSMLTPSSAGLQDPSLSCPGTPSPQHSKLPAMHAMAGPSPIATLRRPTTLSRHASAAGFTLQSWVFTKGQAKGAMTPTPPADSPEGAAIEVEDIPALLRDVARFAEAVEKLKDVVVLAEGTENQRPIAHECLGEVLRVLRQVINTYPFLNTVEILTAAGKLISKVKGFHYEAYNDSDKKDFEKAIETIAVAFSSNVSELLMGEVDSSTLLSLLPTEKSRSMENLYGTSSQDSGQLGSNSEDIGSIEGVDMILQHSEGGVESALHYAKTISKYMKDLISYVEKRTSLEMEFSKGLQRLYQSCKHSITHPHMPLFSIYSLALEQDQELSVGLQQASATLHNQTFIQPLVQQKQEHEKRRKEIKEQWIRAKRKLMDCESNLRKAKQTYMARCEDYKAKAAASRAEEEGAGTTAKSLDKKKRLEEEARNKAEEAEATYRTCIADATSQMTELEHTKITVLRQLQDIIKQSDQTLRSATISYYQLMHMQTVALPVCYQTLCESSKLYDPGQQYAAHVRDLQLPDQPAVCYTFEAYTPSGISHLGHRPRNDSFNTEQTSNSDSPTITVDATCVEADAHRHPRQGHKSWGSTVSDDSVVGDGGLESPTASTTDINKMARTSSTGTMSSNEDTDEKDGNVASFETPNINGMDPDVVVSTRPFRNVGLSKAAKTHRLRKLRTPAKCRECDSYVYFQGAECEECFLACHKRCLETLAIQCGHKKLQGRLQLFGREFALVASCASDGIPFIITKCISEIERRALKMKGIYRVNGVKTRVEKLCQAFENGKELVELSQCSPHDISNVLKLYLRQLPEPIMPFHIYNSLMGLAKESMHSDAELAETSGGTPAVSRGSQLVDLGPETEPEILVLVDKLRELLKELPKANLATLRYLIRHLRRIAELEEENKMSPSNLGIVFGPSLMRPRPTGATISLSSLVDYPHQARIVEALIVFYFSIFQSKSSPSFKTCRSASTSSHLAQASEDMTRSSADGEEDGGRLRKSKSESDKMDEGCGTSSGSMESNEQLPDSDSELDDTAPRGLSEQEVQLSVEDDQLSYRDSLDLSSPTDPDQEADQDHADDVQPPQLPHSGPPDEDTGNPEGDLCSSLAKLNVNQSNNYYYCSPLSGRSRILLARLCGKKLPLTKYRASEPEFV